LSVNFLEKAPQAITTLSKIKLWFSVLKTGFSSSKLISLIFTLLNFPPFFKNKSKSFKRIFFGFLACLA